MPVPTGSLFRRGAPALALAAALALLTACSSDDPSSSTAATSSSASSSSAAGDTSSSGAESQAQEITATEAEFSITLDGGTDLTAGDYTINVTNTGNATHDLVIEQDGNDLAKSETLQPGTSGTVTATLEPGEYVFYCSIGNHRAMGMEITVTVS